MADQETEVTAEMIAAERGAYRDMSEIQEGCELRYLDDCAVATVVFRLEYDREHREGDETQPSQGLSPAAARLRASVERYLGHTLGLDTSLGLRKPSGSAPSEGSEGGGAPEIKVTASMIEAGERAFLACVNDQEVSWLTSGLGPGLKAAFREMLRISCRASH